MFTYLLTNATAKFKTVCNRWKWHAECQQWKQEKILRCSVPVKCHGQCISDQIILNILQA